MARPLAVVVGFVGKLPVAGMTLYNLHYVRGLQSLGYDVHYVERLNYAAEAYDPSCDQSTDDPSYALAYLRDCLPRYGVPSERVSFIDRAERCHGSGWPGLKAALRRADFVLTLADPTWFDELALCPRRGFVDGDPLFTQVALLGEGLVPDALAHYERLFTIGTRLGRPDCLIPSAGREWIKTRSVVATELWQVAPERAGAPVTSVMNWAAWKDVEFEGRSYGHKSREMERLIDLPRHVSARIAVALGGASAPRQRLRDHGWELVDPLAATQDIPSYQAFIAGSWADLGVAKHAYVASRSGWFSDRSLCYLASGRPVLHQDTGLSDWLPTGERLLLFRDRADVLEGLEALSRDYALHSRAARRIAEEHFEAAPVVGRLLDEAGYR